jgi:tartrate dehydratase alpha subunit/fumarate hydratase class I-like protein
MKQTAVEYLIDWMGKNQYFIGNDLLQAVEQAKEMEKQQIMKAVFESMGTNIDPNMGRAEQYFNETYKNTKE